MNSRPPVAVGFPGLLTVAFIVLKLSHVIAWSWVWVLSPLWIILAFGLVALPIFYTLDRR